MMTTPDDLAPPNRTRARYGLAGIALLLVVALVVSAVSWYQPAPASSGDGVDQGITPGGSAGRGGCRHRRLAALGLGPRRPERLRLRLDDRPGLRGPHRGRRPGRRPARAGGVAGASRTAAVVSSSPCGTTSIYSDGTPITAEDVVASWLRLLDPASPSPLASLLSDVVGANERLAGRADEDAVGIRADGRDVIVDFRRPSAYFPAVAASPTLAVLPPAAIAAFEGAQLPDDLVVSGAYRPDSPDVRGDHARGKPALLGRRAGPGHHPDRQRPRRQDGRRGLRGGRHRLRTHLGLRRRLDRLRRDARAPAPTPHGAGRRLLRLRHDATALRRRPCPPGLRHGRGLATDRRPDDARRDPGHLAGAAWRLRSERRRRPAGLRPGGSASSAGRGGLSRAGWAFPRSPS